MWTEWSATLSGMPMWTRLINSLFMSVTARTAGFNTIDHAEATDSTNFLTILLMFVGGSPGSTAGGLKTTTVALIALLAWARFRGRETASVAGRSIPEETVQRAVGLCVIAFGVVTLAILVYVSTEFSGTARAVEGSSFLSYMFEATSAFNTVGLSMGVTGELSTGGRWLTILLMYVGRVGPLSFAASIALPEARPAREFRYAYEEVVVG
jgi:trk system potassium uptake protein TrkH